MRKVIIVRLALGLSLLAAAGTMSACNTSSAVGEDVSVLSLSVTTGAGMTKRKM